MQQGGIANLFHFGAREANVAERVRLVSVHDFGQRDGQIGNAKRVAVGRRIPRFDGAHRRTNETLEQIFDIFIEPGIFQRDGRLTRQRSQQSSAFFWKRHDVSINQAPFRRVIFTLTVDELHDADHLAARVFHGDREHRPRTIAAFLVEHAIEIKRVRRWDLVDVGELNFFAGHRDIARHAGPIQGQDGFREGDFDAVVPRNLESQPFCALVVLLDHVE